MSSEFERDFRVFQADTLDFVGAFCTTESNARNKAIAFKANRNRLKRVMKVGECGKLLVESCYSPGMKTISFTV